MKRLLLFSLVLFAIACTKTSSYRGLITNAADNKPLAGVSCYMSMQVQDNHQLKGDFDNMITDSTGYYALEVKERRGYCGMRFSKPGYVTHLLEYEYGDCKELDLQMYPYDAVLYVTFENTSATASRRYWYEIAGEPFILFQESGPTGYGPYTVPPNGKRTHVKRISGNTEMEVYWATHPLTSPYNTEKVFCPRNDTISITIPF